MKVKRLALTMKSIAAAIVIIASVNSASAKDKTSDDPCGSKPSNVEMRECYTTEQHRVTAEADLTANKIAASFHRGAQDPKFKGPVADELRKAASSVIRSQKTWRTYREQHCNAVASSFTTGSGASTGYESCLLQLAQERLRQLRTAFEQDSESSVCVNAEFH